jgi:hypothetical protein
MTNNIQRMIITNAGNVGIGTSIPSQLLHIVGNTVLPGTGFAENLKLESSTPEVGLSLNNTSAAGHEWFIQSTGTGAIEGAGRLAFYDTIGGFPGGWRMLINESGNVGIGTVNPATRLHVTSDSPGTGDSGIAVDITGIGTRRVIVGAPDSGAPGFRVLMVGN